MANRNARIQRLARFFQENPSEYLTYQDIVQKFGFGTRRAAEATVSALKRQGKLRTAVVVVAA